MPLALGLLISCTRRGFDSPRGSGPDDVDVRPRHGAPLSIRCDQRGGHLVFARWNAAKFEDRRLRRAIPFELDHARAQEILSIRDHFDRAVVGIGLDARSNDEVGRRERRRR